MPSDGTVRDGKILILGGLSALCALLTVFNVFIMGAEIRDLQTNVATRQQFIKESIPLAKVNTQIIQALANMSAQSNDVAIRDMLARHGVTFSTAPLGTSDRDQTQ